MTNDAQADRAHAFGRAGVTLAGLGGVLLAGRAVGIGGPPCPLRTLTGVPCPACGMTRLADALTHGDIGRALAADPIGVALLVTIAVLACLFLVARLRQRDPPGWTGAWAFVGVLSVLALARWADAIVGGLPLA